MPVQLPHVSIDQRDSVARRRHRDREQARDRRLALSRQRTRDQYGTDISVDVEMAEVRSQRAKGFRLVTEAGIPGQGFLRLAAFAGFPERPATGDAREHRQLIGIL